MTIATAGCATYNHAQNVKTIAFSDNLEKGQAVGNVRGDDCTWRILGYQLGGLPTVDRAFEHVRNQTDGSSLSGSVNNSQAARGNIRYLNNVTSKNTGFDAVVVGKTCITVTGVGYR